MGSYNFAEAGKGWNFPLGGGGGSGHFCVLCNVAVYGLPAPEGHLGDCYLINIYSAAIRMDWGP